MKKNSFFLLAALLIVVGFSSCGIFGKGCGCPEFGKIKLHNAAPSSLRVIARQSQTVQSKMKVHSA
jgi:hypothetical protein